MESHSLGPERQCLGVLHFNIYLMQVLCHSFPLLSNLSVTIMGLLVAHLHTVR